MLLEVKYVAGRLSGATYLSVPIPTPLALGTLHVPSFPFEQMSSAVPEDSSACQLDIKFKLRAAASSGTRGGRAS